ncbi:MAG: hypothetical protein IT410_02960 [Candidatus Doudnabacteria bacterium]|nr:hypothetical protein [Candidatus Doudnabacteria bacterium]
MLVKHHKIISAVISIVLAVALQVLILPDPVFRVLIPTVAVFIIGIGAYTAFYMRGLGKVQWWVVLRTVLVFAAWIGLFFIIPNNTLRTAFLIIGLPVLYYFEVTVGNAGEQLLFNELVISAFGLFMLLGALAQYFARIGSWYVVIAFIITVLLCRATYEITPHGLRSKWLGSVIIGLCMSELFWALSFLPLHYSVLGFILFVIFYAIWSLYYYYLFNQITTRKIQFQLGLSALFIALVLLTTPLSIIS